MFRVIYVTAMGVVLIWLLFSWPMLTLQTLIWFVIWLVLMTGAILLMVLVSVWVEQFIVGLAKWWRDYRPYPAIDDKRYANPLRPDRWGRREGWRASNAP